MITLSVAALVLHSGSGRKFSKCMGSESGRFIDLLEYCAVFIMASIFWVNLRKNSRRYVAVFNEEDYLGVAYGT